MKTRIVLLICIFIGAYGQHLQASPAAETDTLSIWVNGACGMCQTRIEEAAQKVRGVEEASWDVESRRLSLTVDPEKFKVNKLHYKIASVGHDTEELLAPDPVYDALPGCCKYRDPNNVHFQENSREEVRGYVYESNDQGDQLPLLAANVYWAGTTTGTTTGNTLSPATVLVST